MGPQTPFPWTSCLMVYYGSYSFVSRHCSFKSQICWEMGLSVIHNSGFLRTSFSNFGGEREKAGHTAMEGAFRESFSPFSVAGGPRPWGGSSVTANMLNWLSPSPPVRWQAAQVPYLPIDDADQMGLQVCWGPGSHTGHALPIREEASLPDLLLYRRLSCAASSLEEALLVSCHKNTSWVSFSLCLVGRGWSWAPSCPK